MSKKILYRTVIKLELLSEEPIPDGLPISEIVREANEGDYSMRSIYMTSSNNTIKGKAAANCVIAQGSDPEFFGMDEQGNEIEI